MENGRDIRALAIKGSVSRDVNFTTEGDDWRRIVSGLKWRYIRLIYWKELRWFYNRIIDAFGERRGSQLIALIKRVVPWVR